jgi:hypothetical protein
VGGRKDRHQLIGFLSERRDRVLVSDFQFQQASNQCSDSSASSMIAPILALNSSDERARFAAL